MRAFRLLSATLAAGLLAAAPLPAQVAAGTAGGGLAGSGSSLISVDELSGHATYLASDALAGRRAGTPGAERAALYIVRTLTETVRELVRAGGSRPPDPP